MRYAVIKLSGRQFLVSEGDKFKVDRLSDHEGHTFTTVPLLVSEGGSVMIGAPEVKGAGVSLKILEHLKDKKIMVRRFKSKSRYRRKKGHRQPISIVEVLEVETKKKVNSKTVQNDTSTNLDSLGLSTRALNALKAANVASVNDLENLTLSDVLQLKGIGKKTGENINNKVSLQKEIK